jgi:hypothetical protein
MLPKGDDVKRNKPTSFSKVVPRLAVVAFVAVLGIGATACGSKNGSGTNDQPAATTVPAATAASSAATPAATEAPTTVAPTTAATTAPPTTSPQSGGAGF